MVACDFIWLVGWNDAAAQLDRAATEGGLRKHGEMTTAPSPLFLIIKITTFAGMAVCCLRDMGQTRETDGIKSALAYGVGRNKRSWMGRKGGGREGRACLRNTRFRTIRNVKWTRTSKLQQTGTKVSEGSFHQQALFFEMADKMMPEMIAREDLGIAENDNSILGSCQGDI